VKNWAHSALAFNESAMSVSMFWVGGKTTSARAKGIALNVTGGQH